MLESPLTGAARAALNRYSSKKAVETLLPLWLQFEDFLRSNSLSTASILDIPEDTLRAYASYLDHRDCHVDDALVALSAVLLVCLHAGYSGKILRSVVIPRIRRPVENRQWDAFRLRTYQPLESSQFARSRRRRAKREACARDAARADNALM
ncbi:hypothetical protein LMG28140_05514 [Paraburkholderia metrosideri]|uniref:Core-binding (CB) domain-containing protein n=1 Tax=Paraburkholderia metrosideri TaxID=580937 RepID=A0ABN7I6G0_9BURK|nr:hypothetical protein LMG28140_05514 [Paraburkholderia metrosideri]